MIKSERCWLALLLACSLLGMAGCSQVPTQGPIERVEQTNSANPQSRLDVAALPPAPDAGPELILEGFLAACENPADGYAIARQYLTPQAAKSWRPEAGAAIYATSSETKVITAEGAAILRMLVVGELDANGLYTAVRQPIRTHDFALQRVDGQWRIGNPGDGVLLSKRRFERAYRAQQIFHLQPDKAALLPEQRFLPVQEQSPESLVRALLVGPSQWLSPVAESAFPPATTSSGSWRDGAGVVHVNLSEQVAALPDDQRVRLAAQLLWTFRAAGWGDKLTVLVGGRPLVIRGMDSNGVIRATDLGSFAPPASKARRQIFAISNGQLVTVPDIETNQTRALSVQPNLPDQRPPTQLAVVENGQLIAVSEASRTMIQIIGAGQAGSEPISAQDVTALQFDQDRNLWWVSNANDQPTLWQRSVDGSLNAHELVELAGHKVVNFKISPDRTRIAVICTAGGEQRFGLLRIRAAEQLLVDGWREIPVLTEASELTLFRDLEWQNPTKLLLVAASPASQRYVVNSVDVDAAFSVSLGPLSDAQPFMIAAGGAAESPLLLTEQGRLLRHEEQYRWTPVTDELSTVTYSV